MLDFYYQTPHARRIPMTTIEQLRDKYPAYLVEHAGDMTDYDIGAMAALLDKWTASHAPLLQRLLRLGLRRDVGE
jgi:hypothetical protein